MNMANFFLTRSIWKLTFGLCVFSARVFTSENCVESETACCIKDPLPEHISVSHTEGKGLGYSRGYSSLDLFLSQPFADKTLVPFLDLRGHIFNNGKYAANAGLGFRYLTDCYKQVWGINLFYDYLQTSRRPYNQVGGGLEALGKHWDARVNYYIPVGHKKTNIYRFEYESFGAEAITGNPALGLADLNAPGFLVKAREQFALKCIDSLIGYRFCKTCWIDLNVAGGPYYLWGNSAKTKNAFRSKHEHVFGGCLRAKMFVTDYIILEGVTTYDSLFKWTGQGTLAINLPFNFTFRLKRSCCVESSYCLKERLYQSVLRNEIIVVDSLNRFSDNPEILDPEFEP